LGATPICVRRRLWRVATAALTAAVVFVLFASALADTANAGIFSDAASRLFGRSKSLDLAPIVGAPANVSQELAQELVAAGKNNKLTITPNGTGSSYTIKGYLLATSERKGAKVSYILDINDSKGGRVGRVQGEQLVPGRSKADPWSGVDGAALRSLAAQIAPQIASTLSGGSSAPPPVASDPPPSPGAATSAGAQPPTAPATAPAPRAAKGPVTAMVSPVSGAPGDGMKSLTAAIKKRLYAKGVKLTSVQSENTYTVKGIVSLTDASGGKQSIRIDWQVIDPSGKKVGTVSQQNTIPKGSLNGPWGAIADAAAGAAADGIVKLLPKNT
jgi:hypothetical protein